MIELARLLVQEARAMVAGEAKVEVGAGAQVLAKAVGGAVVKKAGAKTGGGVASQPKQMYQQLGYENRLGCQKTFEGVVRFWLVRR